MPPNKKFQITLPTQFHYSYGIHVSEKQGLIVLIQHSTSHNNYIKPYPTIFLVAAFSQTPYGKKNHIKCK